ncbi:Glycogen synthase [Pseudovibrio axinellae]|uniref:Glycogen synthase n=1 Tax=Pseudovibrio axinellae TaxID=989403 RepID=A0A161X8C3_9HYPH|nr:glycosyltransferase [Pseudovibrio axinellae]KZL05371.1 Glycogen synthase [Pseudovibrio axinellae]SER36975.1 UDP-glucose:tetrahydrobiopterin glucosyltransferase [Pseudovibrio axinellae]
MKKLHLLVITSAIAPVGFGKTGGAEITLNSMIEALVTLGGCEVTVLAPEGSVDNHRCVKLETTQGNLQPSMQNSQYLDAMQVTCNDMTLSLISRAFEIQDKYDAIINMSYDFFPMWCSRFFKTPLLHIVSMCSTTAYMDAIICQIYKENPQSLTFHTLGQSATYGINDFIAPIYAGFNHKKYKFHKNPDQCLIWAGRISPEKGIEDALEASRILCMPIKIVGLVEDEDYKLSLLHKFQDVSISWLGYMDHCEFVQEIGNAQAMISTPKWREAMGIVNIEANLAGIPVITYDSGGISEVVVSGVTGYVASKETPASIAGYFEKSVALNRQEIRDFAKKRFSIEAFYQRLCKWISHTVS